MSGLPASSRARSIPEAISIAVAIAPKSRRENGTPGDQGGLTLVGASTPRNVKEEGGSSSRPVLAVGGNFRPAGLGKAPGWGRELLGISAFWAFARKGLVGEGLAGWAMPRSCSLSTSGLSRGKAGAGQAAVS